MSARGHAPHRRTHRTVRPLHLYFAVLWVTRWTINTSSSSFSNPHFLTAAKEEPFAPFFRPCSSIFRRRREDGHDAVRGAGRQQQPRGVKRQRRHRPDALTQEPLVVLDDGPELVAAQGEDLDELRVTAGGDNERGG